jgi:hypothetical protein
MGSHRFFRREFLAVTLSIGALLTVSAQGLLPLTVSADEVTSSSVGLSNATADASGVSYDVTFTPATSATNYILDFCNNSPVVGVSCTAPTGFSAAGVGVGASTPSATVADLSGSTTTVAVTQALTAGSAANIVLTGLHNPTDATDSTTGFYMRVITYGNSTNMDAYTDAAEAGAGGVLDTGGFAMSITNQISVTGTVPETMLFCVSGGSIGQDCGRLGNAVTPPNVALGTNDVLGTDTPSTGSIYTQISTNANSGAVIALKSDETGCGGLELVGGGGGATGCHISPAPSTGFTDATSDTPDFGIKTAAASATAGDSFASGTLVPATGYGTDHYYMNYVAGDGSGVTSTYGAPLLQTGSTPGPVDNENMQLTFGAESSPNTPAGLYTATLQMIATGTF